MIALLRASNIPARYQYGTVRLPIEPVMNWVGGVEVLEAAQNLLGQGGIPNTWNKLNGAFFSVDIEQTWVEAYGQFPNTEGTPAQAQWQAMDPSYKQYDFTQGMNLQEAVPFDAQSFADTLANAATVNEAEGWVQGIDQSFIQTELDTYRQ